LIWINLEHLSSAADVVVTCGGELVVVILSYSIHY
jgi:hypothetical protein